MGEERNSESVPTVTREEEVPDSVKAKEWIMKKVPFATLMKIVG